METRILKTVVFGGYNKEEVDSCLKEYTEKINALQKELKEKRDEIEKKVRPLTEDNEKLQKSLEEGNEEIRSLREQSENLINENLTLKKESEKMQRTLGERRVEKTAAVAQMARYEKTVKVLDEQAASLREREESYKDEIDELQARLTDLEMTNAGLKTENSDLQHQLTELSRHIIVDETPLPAGEASAVSTEPAKSQETNQSFDVVRQVLADAKVNAGLIEAEAREEAERILSDARKEAEKVRSDLPQVIDHDLEEKGIQLIAAKYTIEDYARQLNGLQNQMEALQNHIRSMVDGMPTRVDDYWKGEQYAKLREISDEKVSGLILGEELKPGTDK